MQRGKKGGKSFNRTKLECKYAFPDFNRTKLESFNRTKLECKYHHREDFEIEILTFNRTKLECKYVVSILSTLVLKNPLIELN